MARHWYGMAWQERKKSRKRNNYCISSPFLCVRAYLRTESGEARLGESVNCECDVMWSGESVGVVVLGGIFEITRCISHGVGYTQWVEGN